MSRTPQNLRVLTADGVFEVVWDPAATDRFPFRFLRIECPCAACVNEFTGERILDPATVPADIRPVGVDFAGNYGLKVVWSDTHNSGIYTWAHLERLSQQLPS
jgi:DUF971 family protein